MVAKSPSNVDELPPKEDILRAAYAETALLSEERQDDLASQKKSRKLSYITLRVVLAALALALLIYLLVTR